LRPSPLEWQFESIVDSGFLHLFDLEESNRFVADLAVALRPGGRYYLHAFNVEFSIPNTPRAVPPEEVRVRFTLEKGWRILTPQAAQFHSRVAPPVAATIACVERLG
jgi:hypothetical protein